MLLGWYKVPSISMWSCLSSLSRVHVAVIVLSTKEKSHRREKCNYNGGMICQFHLPVMEEMLKVNYKCCSTNTTADLQLCCLNKAASIHCAVSHDRCEAGIWTR